MKRVLSILMLLAAVWSIPAVAVHAQRGVGESRGVAACVETPSVLTVSGQVVEVKTEPCQATNGRASMGTHFLLKTAGGEILNIHLGPTSEVSPLAEQLTVRREVIVACFRTAKMEANHYVAKSVKLGERTVELRDQGQRPIWAGSVPTVSEQRWSDVVPQGRRGGYRGLGPRRARGWARGTGQGPGWGRNRGPGGSQGRAFVDANRDGICDQVPR